MSKQPIKKRRPRSERVNIYLRRETLNKLDLMAEQMCRNRSKQIEWLIEQRPA